MEHFRTEIAIPKSANKITHQSVLFSLGSCFSSEITEKFRERKFAISANPFGILFHPQAIENALLRIYSLQYYSKSELFKYKELFLSWDHHSSFNSTKSDEILEQINDTIDIANEHLRNTNVVFITLATSFVYKLKVNDLVVANCHKVPNGNFEKLLLSEAEIIESLQNCIDICTDMCRNNVKIIFTISPVRHIKDGFVENNISKSRLINAVYQSINKNNNCSYFPSYELLLDELRDYRFYKKDMIHPNELAIDYIWKKFSETYFSDETQAINTQLEKIISGLQHKPFNINTLEYKEFLYSLLKKATNIEKLLIPKIMEQEIQHIKNLLQNAY